MKGIIVRWIISAIALYLTSIIAQWLKIGIILENWWSAMLAVVALAIVNSIIRPLVIMLTLPLNCLTLGIFTFIINAFMFWLAGLVIPGFTVEGIWAAIFGSIVMGIISGLANRLIAPEE